MTNGGLKKKKIKERSVLKVGLLNLDSHIHH